MGRSMMDQYDEIKSAHPDTVLFFRMGDFYEMFHDDAVTASEVLGLALTSRDKNSPNPIPMAGFPWHALENNLRIMVSNGHKITVCEQEEELREGAKLLERVVTRVYTPGSLYEESLLEGGGASRLAALIIRQSSCAVAIVDISTGEVWTLEFVDDERYDIMLDELMRWDIGELVVTPRTAEHPHIGGLAAVLENVQISQHQITKKVGEGALKRCFGLTDLGSLGLDDHPDCLEALGLAASYLSSLHQSDAVPLRDPQLQHEQEILKLDRTTLRNLELIETLAREKEGSLFSRIDHTKTWMGRRMMKSWLMRPLKDVDSINKRQDAVSSLSRASRRLSDIRSQLQGMRDLERLSTKLSFGNANGRDLVAIANALERMPQLKQIVEQTNDSMLVELGAELDSLQPMAEEICAALLEEQPLSIRDGGLFREGFSMKLDELRKDVAVGMEWLRNLESSERERLEIPSLKVRHNRQLGWFIEVTRTHLQKVPEEYIRKQTMTNAERYSTVELKHWEDIIFNADERSNRLEYELLVELREKCRLGSSALTYIASCIAQIDVIASLSHVARTSSWCRPELTKDGRIDISQGRHPVLDLQAGFVPNDLRMDPKRRLLLITGPNMGGKSTYLRQTALIVILAQIGSFVPANKARIGIVDRLFTRVGASDDIRRGRSTFMMEMIEVAHILRRATPSSLVLLDEVGRGTSTFDGLSIAWAVCEDLGRRVKARTLFATHYHQLTGLEDNLDGFTNVHLRIADVDGQLKFLYLVDEGACDESYGIQVAALAGLPSDVVERSAELLQFLESQAAGAKAGDGHPSQREIGQSSLLRYVMAEELIAGGHSSSISHSDVEPINNQHQAVIEHLAGIDPDQLSPRDALERIYELKRLLDGSHKLLEE